MNKTMNILKLAVLSALLFYTVLSTIIHEDILTELRKSNNIAKKSLIINKKIFRVNAELKNGVITNQK